MTATLARPFNQKIRIAGLRLATLALVPLLLFTAPAVDGLPAALLHGAGILCVVAAVLGRFWAILYIGGHKNRCVMQDGPYSICRHPLYMFSTIGAVGFGLMLESVTLTLLVGGMVLAILTATATREERDLRRMFGAAYDAYAARVPRIVPDLSGFRTPPRISVDMGTLARNTRDALVFLSLIPLAETLNWLHAAHLLRGFALW
ncbi:isoprenylcysteine carboxylmethyltransferase family protein [Cereibacter sp. SYSU M97828]|nr:isoprenylcysteine carboxylmethyltransferase family protein [Cereibacter flavus]